MFCPAILPFLHLIFERRVLASQTLAFCLGSGQELHQDWLMSLIPCRSNSRPAGSLLRMSSVGRRA